MICSKFSQETTCQISSKLLEFCRRYYQKTFGLLSSDIIYNNKLSYRREGAHLTSLYRTVQKPFDMLNCLEACASVIVSVEISLNIK